MTPEEYFELGLAYIKEKNWNAALKTLLESRKRLGDRPSDIIPARLLSAIGLCLAMAENKIQDGLNYCQRARVMEPYRAELHCYLGMVYLKAGKKGKAYTAFQEGLRVDPAHKGILSQLDQMGVRKKPALPFLSRGHFLNRMFGRLAKGGNQPTRSLHQRHR